MQTKTQNPTLRLMFGGRADGVITAVHYGRGGRIAWARAYERRGPTWSDHVLLDREQLIARLKSRRRFYTGRRERYLASEFELGGRVLLKDDNLRTEGAPEGKGDQLEGVPVL
ncbi:MAG: hypothetical protein HYZ26_04300 [Chloroflexi bacterium]|nr:hypothetical protein [Chloroflexota bacterium]